MKPLIFGFALALIACTTTPTYQEVHMNAMGTLSVHEYSVHTSIYGNTPFESVHPAVYISGDLEQLNMHIIEAHKSTAVITDGPFTDGHTTGMAYVNEAGTWSTLPVEIFSEQFPSPTQFNYVIEAYEFGTLGQFRIHNLEENAQMARDEEADYLRISGPWYPK